MLYMYDSAAHHVCTVVVNAWTSCRSEDSDLANDGNVSDDKVEMVCVGVVHDLTCVSCSRRARSCRGLSVLQGRSQAEAGGEAAE